MNVAGVLQEAGDADSKARTRCQVLIMIGHVVEHFLTSQSQAFWKIMEKVKNGKMSIICFHPFFKL